jgi:PAS domain S-box-containing protein
LSPSIGWMQDPLQELKDQKFALDQSAIVAQTDARGVITYVNDKFCEISGYSRGELIGKDHRVVNSGTHPKSFFQNMWRTISSGQIWRADICNRKKTGEFYWVATTITPFLDENRKPYQYLAIRQDITELKRAQETILNQQSQLVNASKLSAIGEMAAAITHEINNPLGVILGRTEMIQALNAKGQLDKAALQRLTETILVTGKRIEKIVRSMKSLAREGQADEPFVAHSVREIISDTLELCTQRYRNHGIRLATPTLDHDLTLECHDHQIVQILVNLLNNAFDAVSPLSEKWVELGLKAHGDFIDFTITDSGSGISEEVQNKLFQPFFSTKRVQYGTGLGLSICRSIAEQHGGQIYYDSEVKNTRFVVRLPRKRA